MVERLSVDSSPIGPVDISASAIVQAAQEGLGPKYPIATLNEIAAAIISYSQLAGLRPSYVAGHIFEETGAFHFGGDVVPEQFNFGGIGTTGGGVRGVYFHDVQQGMRAQIAHEAGYIYGAVVDWPREIRSFYADDPRAVYVVSGPHAASIKKIADLGSGNWAAAASGPYSAAIVKWANRLIELSGDIVPTNGKEVPVSTAPTIVDLRGILYTNPNGGPNDSNPNKVGIIDHYNGPPPNNDAFVQYKNDAVYHANKDWGGGSLGDGIMYHYGIQSGEGATYPDGTIFQLRDEDAILWHCGAWVPGGNGTGIAININIGEGQHASLPALASAKWLEDDIVSRYGMDRQLVKGHQEVSPTACPGLLMGDLVIPYREGSMGGTVQPVAKDDFLHENGFIIGGGFKSIVTAMESISHRYRMIFLGYALSNEGDGILLIPETRGDGSLTGRYSHKDIVLQKFERNTLIHESDEPNPEWQDVVPLTNRGYLAGFATDPAIAAILHNPNLMIPAGQTALGSV